MAVTDQQKLDFLLKKIGYTKTKTGSVVGTGAISGTPKQPFAEAIPSPLVVPNASLWNEADSIPATAPGADTTQVKVYLAGTSGLRMTADSTSSGQRAYIAYTTYNNTSSARLTNWIDTQFGASYLIKVYKGDPNSGGVALSAAGSGSNDGWFFDYSAGVLNFNDTSVPSGVTDTNIYIVGYRYVGQTGAPTSGISTFSYLDLTVERNLDVGVQGGISTFRNNIDLNADIDVDGHANLDNLNVAGVTTFAGTVNTASIVATGIDLNGDIDVDGHTNLDNVSIAGVTTTAGLLDINAGGQANTFKVEDLTDNRIVIAGTGGELEDSGNLTFNGTTLGVTGDATFSGNVSIGGTLTYEDVINVDSVGIITARAGINVTGGVITALAGENKIPSLYANMAALPAAGSYHGMFAHVHSTGRGYFAHAGNWLELVNADTTGRVGTGTESYFIDRLVSTSTTATSLNVTGVTTAVTVDVNGDLDVDGHTNLDNVNIAGITTIADDQKLYLGNDQDLQLYYQTSGVAGAYVQTGSASGNLTIRNADAGQYVYIHGDNVHLRSTTNNETFLQAQYNGAVSLWYDNVKRIETTSQGINVIGHSELDNVNIAGVTTAAGNVDINADLDVDGHTNLDNVSISGFATVTQDLDVDGHTNLDNVSIAGVTTMSGNLSLESTYPRIFLKDTNHNPDFSILNNDGNLGFRDDTNGEYRLQILGTGETKVYHNLIVDKDLDVDGHTNLDNVSISGVVTATTFVGNGDFVELDVDGHTNLDNVSVAGVTTFTGTAEFDGTAKFDSTITAGGATGSNGQYLKTTGTGVEWATFPTMRTRQTSTASAGQTTFSFTYTVNFLDVFVNGIKLTDAEFTATNGSSVVLAVGCFVGDIVELVSYNTVSGGGGGGGGSLNNIVEDTTPQLGGNLDLFNKSITGTGNVNITGVITATNFVGDGSGLTNVIGSGSGVVVKNSGSTVGTAGTINFGDNLSVSAISAGIVTITGSAGVSTSQFDVNKLDVSGISTFKGNIDVNADIDVDGHTNLDNVSIAGVVTATTFVGALTGNVTGNATGLSGTPNISVGTISGSTGTFSGAIDANGDLDVDGHTELDNVNIAGVVTATTFKGALQGTSGTFSSGVDITGDLDVDGHTDLDNVSVAGVTTFASNVSVGSSIAVGTGVTIESNGQATFVGVVTASKFVGDGSSLTGISGGVTSDAQGNTVGGTNSGDSFSGTDAIRNTLYGFDTGTAITTGDRTTAVGYHALKTVSTNSFNSAFGDSSLRETTGQRNNAFGNNAGIEVTSGSDNCFFGSSSGAYCGSSARNTAVGNDSMYRVGQGGEGNYNTGVGYKALYDVRSGDNNTSLGYQAGDNINGSNNIVIGANADASSSSVSNEITLGDANISHLRVPGIGVSFSEGGAVVSGVVTATSFVGDGSGLTGISASGSGVVVKHDGSTVGTAGTINFSTNLDVSAISAGIVTITASGGGASTGEAFVNLRDSSNPPALSNSGRNIIIGVQAAHKFGNGSASGGNENVFLGYVAGYTQTNGDGNVYIGAEAGYSNATSAGNVYVGAGAGRFATGANNVCLGRFAGNAGGFSGSNNLVIGYNSDPSSASVSNEITLGDANITKFRVPGINVVLKDNGGTPTQGHVLTVDANGEAGFAAASSSPNVGITTNLSGSFTASAGSPSTINTFGYGSGDIVVEYTVFIKNGSDFQTQKLLAMRDGTTIHSTQFAVMYSSSLLVQCDATISSGNILLRATPETGISGSTTYKVKREVM